MYVYVIELSADNRSDLSIKSFTYYEEERMKNSLLHHNLSSPK